MFKDLLKHVLLDCNRNRAHVYHVKLYHFVNIEMQVCVRNLKLLTHSTNLQQSKYMLVYVDTNLMFYQLIYTHSSCVWMVNSLHRYALNMLCRLHLKWFHWTWNSESQCTHPTKREKSSKYWSPFSCILCRTICMFCSLLFFVYLLCSCNIYSSI